MTELICVPFKRSLNINLKDELSKMIDTTSYQTSNFFEEDLKKISKMREKMCDLGVSTSRLEELKEYWYGLICLQSKFPDYQIQFTWFQTLSPKSYSCSQYSLVFEQLNVLYNIGSMYSILALDANDGSTKSLKEMCLYFQRSAGCFQYILDHLEDTQEPVFDKNTGLALVCLLLGQAQECFWFKALKDSHKDSLIAKLAQQVVDYYDEAISYSRKSELIRSYWILHLESKKHYFEAVVYYRNGLALGQKNEYGAMVKSLSCAIEHLKKSEMPSKPDFMVTVTEALRNAERDNDFIYLQTVPSSLDPVKPAVTVKPSPLTDFLKCTFDPANSLLRDLLPVSIMDICAGFNERQEEYITKNISEPLLALNKLLITNLPRFRIPLDNKPITKEEMEHYELALSDQRQKHAFISQSLGQTKEILREEAETDDSLRKKYGTVNWTLRDSASLNKAYYDKLKKLDEYAKQGEDVHNETTELFQSIDRKLLITPLKLPESNNPVIQEAYSLVNKREQYIQAVETKSAQHRILPKIITEYKKTGKCNFEPIFVIHMTVFEEDIRYVSEQKHENKALVKKIQDEADDKSVKRLEPYSLYLEDFKYSFELLEEVKKNVESGGHFYGDLLKTVNELVEEVQTFEINRRQEKHELESKLNDTNDA